MANEVKGLGGWLILLGIGAKTRQEHALMQYQEAEQIHVEELSGARASVTKAEERLSYARAYLKTFEELLEARVISRLERLRNCFSVI